MARSRATFVAPPRPHQPGSGRRVAVITADELEAAFADRGSRFAVGPIAAVGLLVATDAFAITAAIARFGLVTPNTAILVVLALWALALGDHYRLRLHLSVLDDMASIAGRVVVAVSLGAAYRELVSGHDVFTVDRLWVLVGSIIFVLAGRTAAYGVLRTLRYAGLLRRSTLVIGSTETTQEMSQAMADHPSAGLTPVADLQFPVAPGTLERINADVAVIEVNDSSHHEVTQLIRDAGRNGPELYLLPTALVRYPALIPGADQLAATPLIPIKPVANRSWQWRFKRIIDVVLAAMLIPVAAPIAGLCAMILRLQDGPGVLFRQERVGLGGRRFTMFKLRTIPVRQLETDNTWSVGPDRISRFGRFCRMTSIDELPQLWNVLRGDMSLVGPRPERPHFVSEFSKSIPDYENRHRVPAGLTGLAQIHGLRGDTSISLRSKADNSYIDNWSLFQDLKIMCRTVAAMIRPGGRGS